MLIDKNIKLPSFEDLMEDIKKEVCKHDETIDVGDDEHCHEACINCGEGVNYGR